MWRSDGRPAKHATLALVLHNETQWKQLFSQGSVCISLNPEVFDPSATAADIAEKIRADPKARKDMSSHLQNYASNVPGTDQYFSGILRKFKAVSFHSNYVNKKPLLLFHTGSMAEFHDPFFRHLLSKYVSVVESLNQRTNDY